MFLHMAVFMFLRWNITSNVQISEFDKLITTVSVQ